MTPSRPTAAPEPAETVHPGPASEQDAGRLRAATGDAPFTPADVLALLGDDDETDARRRAAAGALRTTPDEVLALLGGRVLRSGAPAARPATAGSVQASA